MLKRSCVRNEGEGVELEGAEEEQGVVAGVEVEEDLLQVHVGHLLPPLEQHLHLVELIFRISGIWELQPGATLEQPKLKVFLLLNHSQKTRIISYHFFSKISIFSNNKMTCFQMYINLIAERFFSGAVSFAI